MATFSEKFTRDMLSYLEEEYRASKCKTDKSQSYQDKSCEKKNRKRLSRLEKWAKYFERKLRRAERAASRSLRSKSYSSSGKSHLSPSVEDCSEQLAENKFTLLTSMSHLAISYENDALQQTPLKPGHRGMSDSEKHSTPEQRNGDGNIQNVSDTDIMLYED